MIKVDEQNEQSWFVELEILGRLRLDDDAEGGIDTSCHPKRARW
jgi:hypothetical protein